jgi:DNA-binding transcriptional LysR family regulator
MYDWNDLKHLLAVARHGSTLAAARSLGVNQSTVQRRIAELERKLGCALVERHQSGYRLTQLGEHLQPFAESVASAASAFEHHAKLEDTSKSGLLRLTCPEPIAARLTNSGFTNRFHTAHTDIHIEFVLSDRYVDLSTGEADVALRSGDTEDGVLVGRKIADSIWGIYASRTYVARVRVPQSIEDLAAHPLIGFDEKMQKHRLSIWLSRVAPDAQYAARSSSVLGLVSAAKSGVGIASLPVALGDAEPDLIRVINLAPELTRAWRILCHPNVRQTRRVVLFFDFVHAEIDNLKPVLTG